jgi:hypothetical protein
VEWIARSEPFPHGVAASIFADGTEQHVLEILESVPWEDRRSEFYRFKVPSDDLFNREHLDCLIKDAVPLEQMLEFFERTFECRLLSNVRLEIHRYDHGAGIGPHTDFGSNEVRCVISVNSGWRMENGGVWILAGDSTLRSRPSYLPSLNNTAFAFSVRKDSYHALSTCFDTTYGLTFRFARA